MKPTPLAFVPENQRARLASFGVRSLLLTDTAEGKTPIVLVRPDFYAYGAAREIDGVPDLITHLWRDVSAAHPAPAAQAAGSTREDQLLR